MTTFTITVEEDVYADNPREDRQACLLWLGSPNHPRETTVSFDDFSFTDEFEAEVLRCDMPPGSRVLPVYFYQHGSLALDIHEIPNPHYGFDSGRAGVAFVFPDATDEDVRAELRAYCAWVNGESKVVSLEEDGVTVDSYHGLLGDEVAQATKDLTETLLARVQEVC